MANDILKEMPKNNFLDKHGVPKNDIFAAIEADKAWNERMGDEIYQNIDRLQKYLLAREELDRQVTA